MASPPAPVTFDPKTRSTRLCGSSRRGFPPCDGAGRCRPAHPRSGDGIFLSPAPETSLHVLSNLQKLKSALGLPLLVSVSRKSFLAPPLAFLWIWVQRALRRNFTRSAMALTTSAPTRLEICEAQSPSRKPSRNFAVATPETEG
ncbi:dihydropteroate synthase [Klebsiella pneumoniae]|uniref:dihydropteroate synthase n=1 Tax=Klebsiella pneumoniae TaxID=573 RepID=UPI001E576146|nr:dihydropteroate synthase [Klebsiella pneumoniae]